jgi:tetratricopeptide (TPR) repeat protein
MVHGQLGREGMADPLDLLLIEGIAAVQAGDRAYARSLLIRVVASDQGNLQAWYWLSRVAETPEEREVCLENVLALDPAHVPIQKELADLRKHMAESGDESLRTEDGQLDAASGTAKDPLSRGAVEEPWLCPFCGGATGESDRRCPHCGHGLYSREPKSKGHSGYSLGLVLLWVLSANLFWLALSFSYLLSALRSNLVPASGLGRSLETVMELLGVEGVGSALPGPALLPIALVTGGLFLFSLLVAWGLYRRLAVFYWLTVGVILVGFLLLIYLAVSAEKMPILGLLAGGVCLLLTIAFAFMAHDEYAWESHRLDAFVDSDVDGPSTLFARGRVHARQGMWAKAAAHWSRAVVLNPGHVDYRLALATAYLNLVEPEQARKHLAVVQDLDPDNARAQALLEHLAS